ncbi:MAG: hypothetical protein VX899_24380 [Myxococcota bacterium]|nr:hypothetical protein [Myxococcota bacterium]
MSDERIHGVSLRDCAEIFAMDGKLKAEHGERAYVPHFDAWLRGRGLSMQVWSEAWNAWWARMQNDPSGQLHARFATLQQQAQLASHHADVPAAGSKAGVSLETFAKIMAGAAAGQDMQALVAQEGLTWQGWQQAQAAWNQAMAEDVNHHITTQYGQLYAKHSPGHAQAMQGAVAGQMAADYAQRQQGIDDEPDAEYTTAQAISEMESRNPLERWRAAYHLSNDWDIAEDRAPLHAAAKRAVALHRECLSQFDEHSVDDGSGAMAQLKTYAAEGFLTAAEAEDIKGDIHRAWHRAYGHLQTLSAAFEPLRGKSVPEKVRLQSAIQDYTGFVEDAKEILEEWDDDFVPASGQPVIQSSAPAERVTSPAPGVTQPSGGPGVPSGGPQRPKGPPSLLDNLKELPVLGDLMRALGI